MSLWMLALQPSGGISDDTDFEWHTISNLLIKNYAETVNKETDVAGSIDLDLQDSCIYELSLIGDTTISISNVVDNGRASSITLIIHQDSEAREITWPGSVLWQQGNVPYTEVEDATYVITLFTVDGGATWYGTEVGQYSSE